MPTKSQKIKVYPTPINYSLFIIHYSLPIATFALMIELIYTLFLLVVINFYLMARMRGALTPTQRFMISLMSIFMVFLIFYTVGHIFSVYFARLTAPGFYIAFLLIMNLILPIITTEMVLMGYRYFKLDQKK